MSTSQETKEIERVLGLLHCGDPDALAAAVEIAERFSPSPRATYLPVYVEETLVKMMNRGPEKTRILMRGVNILKSLIKTHDNSIVFALYYARMLILVGDYSAAEVECRRALMIDCAQDPELQQIPLGSVSGKDYCDRVMFVKLEINKLLKLLSLQVQWGLMTAQSRKGIMSVKIDNLMEHLSGNQSAAKSISDALGYFKTADSWNLYICLLTDCDGYFGDAIGLAVHIRLLHLCRPPVSAQQATIDPGLSNVVSLQNDDEGKDILCFQSIEDMLHCVICLPTGSMPPSCADLRAKACEKAVATIERLRDNEHYDEDSKMLWSELFEASVIDYRICILPCLASYMREEMVENGNISIDSFVDFERCIADGHGLEHENMEGVEETVACSASLFGDFDFGGHYDGKISYSEEMPSSHVGVLPEYIDLLTGDAYKSSASQNESIYDESQVKNKAKTEESCGDKHCVGETNSLMSQSTEERPSANAEVLPIYDLLTGDAYNSPFNQQDQSQTKDRNLVRRKNYDREAESLMTDTLGDVDLSSYYVHGSTSDEKKDNLINAKTEAALRDFFDDTWITSLEKGDDGMLDDSKTSSSSQDLMVITGKKITERRGKRTCGWSKEEEEKGEKKKGEEKEWHGKRFS